MKKRKFNNAMADRIIKRAKHNNRPLKHLDEDCVVLVRTPAGDLGTTLKEFMTLVKAILNEEIKP